MLSLPNKDVTFTDFNNICSVALKIKKLSDHLFKDLKMMSILEDRLKRSCNGFTNLD
jgi:hypothetical protein